MPFFGRFSTFLGILQSLTGIHMSPRNGSFFYYNRICLKNNTFFNALTFIGFTSFVDLKGTICYFTTHGRWGSPLTVPIDQD